VVNASSPAPSGAAGYSILNIGPLTTLSPTADGTIIRMVAKNENDIFFVASSIFPFAINEDIIGTSAAQNATVIASGKCIMVSTLASIPY